MDLSMCNEMSAPAFSPSFTQKFFLVSRLLVQLRPMSKTMTAMVSFPLPG
jgi:hypothetical protein